MKYPKYIEGNTDLDQINLQIAGEEAGSSEFKESKISVKDNQPINELTFETLPAGTFPKKLEVVKHTESKPSGTNKVWEGAMVVAGTNTVVIAYRTL